LKIYISSTILCSTISSYWYMVCEYTECRKFDSIF